MCCCCQLSNTDCPAHSLSHYWVTGKGRCPNKILVWQFWNFVTFLLICITLTWLWKLASSLSLTFAPSKVSSSLLWPSITTTFYMCSFFLSFSAFLFTSSSLAVCTLSLCPCVILKSLKRNFLWLKCNTWVYHYILNLTDCSCIFAFSLSHIY
jgi:hypothetical protein